MRLATKAALSVCSILAVSGSVLADDTSSAASSFFDRCLSQGPHFSQTVTLAKSEGWPELASDMTMAFTPVKDPTAMQGWIVGNGETSGFQALVIFKAKIGDKTVEGCAMALAGIDGAAFEKAIMQRVGAKSLGQDQGADTTYKKFSARIGERDNAITISLPRYPNGKDQIIASVVADEVVEN